MKIIGLTGGIAMGKSTAAAMVKFMGVPIHDSDAAVHRLYRKGGAGVRAIAARFPKAISNDGSVDRAKLREIVLKQPEALADLETLIHPLVRAQSAAWLKHHQRHRTPLVVLDIPLLFETGRDREVDAIWVVHCPRFLQQQRALSRPGMTPEKLATILRRQVPQEVRLRQANHIFPTGRGKAALFQALKITLNQVFES